MAIKKKGKTDFLRGASISEINDVVDNTENTAKTTTVVDTEADVAGKKKTVQKYKKDISKWGRPRRLLIEGVKEKSVTVQLPVTLISFLKKECKKSKHSMKELIGEALLDKYQNSLK